MVLLLNDKINKLPGQDTFSIDVKLCDIQKEESMK